MNAPTPIVLGMTPEQALAAGGPHTMMLSPDPAVWPRGSDLNAVLQAQTDRPDGSYLSLVFENSVQYPGATVRFRVVFDHGRVVSIDPLT